MTRYALASLATLALFAAGFAIPGCGLASGEPAGETEQPPTESGVVDTSWGYTITKYNVQTGSLTITLDEPITWPLPWEEAPED